MPNRIQQIPRSTEAADKTSKAQRRLRFDQAPDLLVERGIRARARLFQLLNFGIHLFKRRTDRFRAVDTLSQKLLPAAVDC